MNIQRARTLRKTMPPAEVRMWNLLRKEPFKHFHFRRQVQIGPYYADFASHSAKLVVEIDGDSHFTEKGISHDRVRDQLFTDHGFSVFRVTNLDVLKNPDGVAPSLLLVLENTPTPAPLRRPSPQGGGRRLEPTVRRT